MHLAVLTILFLVVALAYSAVGFGGGSSYNALLVLSGTDYRAIPAIALTCNILVVSGGVYHLYKGGHLEFGRLLPFAVFSVPMAWFGASLAVQESTFVGLLGLVLLITGLQILWQPGQVNSERFASGSNPWLLGLPLGGGIGFLSGIVGVGGGVFLAPVLYLTKWGAPSNIAAMASGFILVNSISGLTGQLMKQGSYSPAGEWLTSWPLFLAVIAGGQLGSRLASRGLPEAWIQRLTSILILYVALRLIYRWFTLTSGAGL